MITFINTYGAPATVAMVAMLTIVFINSPTRQDKTRLGITIVFAILFAASMYFIDWLWDYITQDDPTTVWRLAIFPFLVVVYYLASHATISFAAYKKGGLDNLKSPNEEGLVKGSKNVVIFGVIGGIIFWFTHGLAVSLITILTIELTLGWIKEFED